MRLLYLNHNYRFGGTYYRAMPMAEQMAARGHNVTVMTVSRTQRWRVTWTSASGVHIAETPNWGQDNSGEGYGPPDNLFRIGHALVHPYDIVHMFDHKPNATFAGLPARLRGAQLIADWADWWGGAGGINDVPKRRVPAVGAFEQWWEERSKRWANGVVTISTVLRQRALNLGCPPDRVIYIPTGAAVDRIVPLPMAEARQKLNVPPDRKMIGFIGSSQFDMEIVLAALRNLPDVWWMIVGHRAPHVLDAAQRFGVADRLWQTGVVSDDMVSLYLACANLMVMPMSNTAANRGRLPNKILDYMAAGRAFVASPVCDVRTIVEEHKVGLLAEVDGFASAIDQLLTDRALCAEMGQAGRHTATTAFGWANLSPKLEAFYTRLLAA